MAAADATLRSELARDGSLFEGYNTRMAKLHERNARELAAIVTTAGWPGRGLVGDEGAEAAWRVLQHAIGHPERLGVLRTSVGLPPLEEQQERMRAMVARDGERPPANYERRQREIRAWAEKVGWLGPRSDESEGS